MERTLIATQTLQLEEIANPKRVRTMLKMVAMLQVNYVLMENDRREAPFFPMVLRYLEVKDHIIPDLNVKLTKSVGNFRRAQVKPDTVPRYEPQDQSACPACLNQHGPHEVGYCPLKLAGVEYCNLCGLAHFAIPGSCITLKAKERFSEINEALKKSPEADATAKAARKILRKLKADIVERERRTGEQGQSEAGRKLGPQQEQLEQLKRRKLAPINGSETPRYWGSVPHSQHAGELRAVDTMFARNGAGMGMNGPPPGYSNRPGTYAPHSANPYPNPPAAGVDRQAAAFAAVSEAPRQFSTFNKAPPPAGQ